MTSPTHESMSPQNSGPHIIDGRLNLAVQMPCSNCDERPNDEISLIVIHCISLPEGHFGTDYVSCLFGNNISGDEHTDFKDLVGLEVSSHLFIRRTGEVLQYVPFQQRAWHAGESHFQGRSRCNDFSVGIELEGTDRGAFTDEQYEALIPIVVRMCQEWQIDLDHVVGHSDIAPGRKTDPGPGFDWQRLRDGVQES